MTETQTKIERGRKKRQRQIERDREKLREGTENRTISKHTMRTLSRFPHIVFFSLFLVPIKRKKEWGRGGESEGGERAIRGR